MEAEYTAQELLDEIHELNIPQLFVDGVPSQQLKEDIKLTKKRLRLIKQRLNQSIKTIEKAWDGRNAYEAKREREELGPYLALKNSLLEIEVLVSELSSKGPREVSFKPLGEVLVYDKTNDRWLILSKLEAIKFRANELKEIIESSRKAIEDSKELLNRAKSPFRLILPIVTCILGLSTFALIPTFSTYLSNVYPEQDQMSLVTLAFGFIGLVLLGYGIASFMHRQNRIRALGDLIGKGENLIHECKKEINNLKKQYSQEKDVLTAR